MERLTYKSQMGDYGSLKEYESERAEIIALRNALGKYEDAAEAKVTKNAGGNLMPIKQPEVLEFEVTYKSGVNYTPRAAFERWAKEDYEPIYYDDGMRPYVRLYGGRYFYDRWEITKSGDTERVKLYLKRE